MSLMSKDAQLIKLTQLIKLIKLTLLIKPTQLIKLNYLERPPHGNAKSHKDEVYHAEWHKVLPLKRKDLVNSQTWESPTQPHEQEHNEERLTYKPYRTWDIVHHAIESVKTIDVEWCPTTKEDGRSHTCTDEEIEVFSKIVVAEVHT